MSSRYNFVTADRRRGKTFKVEKKKKDRKSTIRFSRAATQYTFFIIYEITKTRNINVKIASLCTMNKIINSVLRVRFYLFTHSATTNVPPPWGTQTVFRLKPVCRLGKIRANPRRSRIFLQILLYAIHISGNCAKRKILKSYFYYHILFYIISCIINYLFFVICI